MLLACKDIVMRGERLSNRMDVIQKRGVNPAPPKGR